jgi:hypothetical protein
MTPIGFEIRHRRVTAVTARDLLPSQIQGGTDVLP